MSVAQVPAAAASVAFTILYFTHLKSGDVLAACLCLALARRARFEGGKIGGGGVLGTNEVEHGNSGRKGAERRANEWRDRRVFLALLLSLNCWQL